MSFRLVPEKTRKGKENENFWLLCVGVIVFVKTGNSTQLGQNSGSTKSTIAC